MAYAYRVSVSYGDKPSKLGILRELEAAYEELRQTCEISQQLWFKSSHSLDERRDACTAVVVAMVNFVLASGAPLYARERMNDLLVALGELQCGRHSSLLSPAPVHPGKFSATDLQQQAMAQVCVDLLREAGASATDARRRVSGLFEKHQLPKFSEAKLRTLNSRLKGPGSTQDEAFGTYQWTKTHAERTGMQLGIWPILSLPIANKLTEALIALAKNRDHRRDFFFAPREDRSGLP